MLNPRTAAALPFVAVGIAAVIAGGATAAAVAYQPTEHLVWMVAYLVLVVGVMQCAFGAGQAWLAQDPPPGRVTWGQWGVFNLGNAGWGPLPIIVLVAFILTGRARANGGVWRVCKRAFAAYRRGRRSRSLVSVVWEDYWHMPVHDVQALLCAPVELAAAA